MRPHVFVTRRLPEPVPSELEAAADVGAWPEEDRAVPADVLRQGVRQADGLLCLLTDRVDADLLDSAPRLRVVSNMAVGYDNIDVAAASARGVAVCNTPGILTETTADLAFALLLAAARRLPESERLLREGGWQTWSPLLMAGRDVYGATLGIVGAGRIGQAVASRARGFGMRILYTARGPKLEFERSSGAVRCEHLAELLAASDFVSLHVPLTAATRGMIGEAELRRMKPTAVLINTARGPLVDEAALGRALREGWIWGAGIDVWAAEPASPQHPLLGAPRLVALPHIGSASIATRTRMARMAADNLLAVLGGRRPPHCVNPEVLTAER